MTVNHVQGRGAGAPDCSVVTIGGVSEDPPGLDLTGLVVGSEGTFGIVTKVIVNLSRDPEAGRTLLGVFDTVEAATETVSGIIAAGIIPAALEMLDNLMIQAVEQAFGLASPPMPGDPDHRGRWHRRGLDREAGEVTEIVQSRGGRVQKSITGEPERNLNTWQSGRAASRPSALSAG